MYCFPKIGFVGSPETTPDGTCLGERNRRANMGKRAGQKTEVSNLLIFFDVFFLFLVCITNASAMLLAVLRAMLRNVDTVGP